MSTALNAESDATPGARDFDVIPQTGRTGAEIKGLDVSRPLTADRVAGVRAALLRWKVLFFRDQPLTHEQHAAFLGQFGEVNTGLITDAAYGPNRGVPAFQIKYEYEYLTPDSPPHVQNWHVDGLQAPQPPELISLRTVTAPPYGGDTAFSNLAAAYEELPQGLRELFDKLRFVARVPSYLARGSVERQEAISSNSAITEHPLVRVHPESGERGLLAEHTHADYIVGVTAEQSRRLLDIVRHQINRPAFQVRLHWEPNTVALWDNRAVAHYAPNDLRHLGHKVGDREAYRFSTAGSPVIGVDGRTSTVIRASSFASA